MSSPVGYPQRNAYPMFSSTSQGDVPVGKNGANLIPVMASISSSGGIEVQDGSDTRGFVTAEIAAGVPTGNFSQPGRAAKSRYL